MNNFKKGGFKKGGFGGRPSFGGDKKFGSTGRGYDRGDKKSSGSELFSATCSTCHKMCKVPFRPSSDKPVYCSECFSKKDSGNSRDFRGGERSSGEFRRDSHAPRREESFGRNEQRNTSSQTGNDDLKRQLDTMESKINRILEHISTHARSEHTVIAEVAATPKKKRESKTIIVSEKKNILKKRKK